MNAFVVPSAARRTAPGAARRALFRWAFRLFRREWRQQLLVLALLTVAVATTVVGLAVAATSTAAQAAEFGDARLILDLGRADAAQRSADVAAARAKLGAAESIAHAKFLVPGLAEPIDVRDQDPRGVFGSPLLWLHQGRFPRGGSEVALTAEAATTIGVSVGGSLDVAGATRTLVGIVENPRKLSDTFALVAPGSITAPDHVDLLVDAPDNALHDLRLPGVDGISVKGYSPVRSAEAAGVVLAISSVGMLFVGLLAVAGFAVMAQRRRRALGMLAAVGASDRQVRQTLIASGAITGAAGALAGAGLGLVVWIVLAGPLEGPFDHRIARFDLPWWSVGGAVVLAVFTAIGAAWWPARSASKLSIVAALSGRPPEVTPAHRSAAAGVVMLCAGAGLLVVSDGRKSWAIIGGSLATVVGMLMLAPLAVRALGALAGRTSVAPRLALRDLARYRARSGAAVGAAALALGIAATVSLGASVAAANDRASAVQGNLPVNETMIYAGRPDGGPTPLLDPPALDAARAAVAKIVGATAATGSAELQKVRTPNGSSVGVKGITGVPTVDLVEPDVANGKTVGFRLVSTLYVADAATLRYLGLDLSTVKSGIDIITPRTDLATAEIINVTIDKNATTREETTAKPTFQHLDLPVYTSRPSTLITPSTVDRLGLTAFPAAWAIRTAQPLTAEQVVTVRRLAGAAGLTIEVHHDGPAYDRLRLYATGIGMLVALAVLVMSVGLIRAESAGDARILTATGASPRIRRAIVATTAAALGFLGGVLAVIGAYVAMIAWQHSDLTPLRPIPVADLAAIVIGMPLLAALGGWVLAGREPVDIGRVRID
jgi:putative ABC transport system permease protein